MVCIVLCSVLAVFTPGGMYPVFIFSGLLVGEESLIVFFHSPASHTYKSSDDVLSNLIINSIVIRNRARR